MKLKKDFIIHHANGETILVATGKSAFAGIVRGNNMFKNILELLKNDTSETAIINAIEKRYNAPRDKITKDVHGVIVRLKKIGAIDG